MPRKIARVEVDKRGKRLFEEQKDQLERLDELQSGVVKWQRANAQIKRERDKFRDIFKLDKGVLASVRNELQGRIKNQRAETKRKTASNKIQIKELNIGKARKLQQQNRRFRESKLAIDDEIRALETETKRIQERLEEQGFKKTFKRRKKRR